MPARRPEDRALIASIAAHTSWANTTDPAARTAKARAAFTDRFEREADPDGTLPADERARRAEHLRRAHYKRLALKSAQARRKSADRGAEQ
ncbi:hypothetical protein [Geodermatophilus chilensis]|uniref:hypothetical protein n=1 Tax=Geodermatophilus chilensis TaxID=2035835 RepID=UPI000C269329|nr:hypothetical protein [Geodermatophilus chilensis]